MDSAQHILLTAMVLAVFSLSFFIVFGDNGFFELKVRKKEHLEMIRKNNVLIQENLALYRTIKRLDDEFTGDDLKFIENIARQELGVVRANELIFKFEKADQKGPK